MLHACVACRSGLLASMRSLIRRNKTSSSSTGASKGSDGAATHPLQQSLSGSSGAASEVASSSLEVCQKVVQSRRTCRLFDTTRPVDLQKLQSVLDMTVRSPTAFNLQSWNAIVVHDADQREALCRAALGQSQVRTAPVTVVFAGDMEAERYAAQALEMGLESRYYPAQYGPTYLRNVYYFLHGGPFQALAHTKAFLSTAYTMQTGTPLLSVPVNMQAYAWKQTMIPATTFVHLCTAAGWDTAIMEGIDEQMVKGIVGLPSRFTVPVIISVGYAAQGGHNPVESPRFSSRHLIRWGRY